MLRNFFRETFKTFATLILLLTILSFFVIAVIAVVTQSVFEVLLEKGFLPALRRARTLIRILYAPPLLRVYMPLWMSSSSLKFKDHVLLGKFGITGDLSYTEVVEIPPLLPPSEQKLLMGRNLGYDPAVKIKNYSEFHDKKQELFFKWLVNNGYFKDKIKGQLPAFICFGGSITDPLQSPLVTRFGKWEIFAAKVKDVIFLWDEKKGGGDQMAKDLPTFYGVAFEALMTGKDPKDVNEYEKNFSVQKVSFGKHQLLVMNEIDALKGKGEKDFAEVKVFKEEGSKARKAAANKYLGYWAQSAVAGIKQIVVGKRDDGGRLLSITPMNLKQTRKMGKFSSIQIGMAYDFEDRFLQWITFRFAGQENDATNVKKFSWGGAGYRNVTCRNVRKAEYKNFFPEWFLKSEE